MEGKGGGRLLLSTTKFVIAGREWEEVRGWISSWGGIWISAAKGVSQGRDEGQCRAVAFLVLLTTFLVHGRLQFLRAMTVFTKRYYEHTTIISRCELKVAGFLLMIPWIVFASCFLASCEGTGHTSHLIAFHHTLAHGIPHLHISAHTALSERSRARR